jgi:hypothetical protein
MQIPKPSEADKERFHRLVPADPRVETKPMFGNLAAFVNGNMFMGLFGADVGVKCPKTPSGSCSRSRERDRSDPPNVQWAVTSRSHPHGLATPPKPPHG